MDPVIKELVIAYDSATTNEERIAIKERLDAVAATVATEAIATAKIKYDGAHKRPQYAFNRYRVSDMAETADRVHFKLSPNQIFLKKWLSPDTYNQGVLLFHNVGVGKSCTSIHIAENFKDMFRRQALVILPKSLKATYMRELYNPARLGRQCVGNTYVSQDSKRSTRLIRQRYDLVAFGEFANTVLRMQNNIDLLRETYSNRVIIVDEVHNMRAPIGAAVVTAPKMTDVDESDTEEDVDTNDDKKRASQALMLVLKHAVNTKLVLMSATPIYNDADEIRWIMTLLYTHAKEKRQVAIIQDLKLFNGGHVLTKKARDEIAVFAGRFVSYMNSNPFTFPARLYPIVNNDLAILKQSDFPTIDALTNKPILEQDQIKKGLVLVARQMGKNYQEQKYLEACRKTTQNKDLSRPIQLSNIAFPTATPGAGAAIGGKDLAQWFDSDPKSGFKYRKPILDVYDEFLAPGPNKLSKYAPKMAAIIDYIKNSTGVILVYSRYIWSGIIPLALALEHQGYSRHGNIPLLKPGASFQAPAAGKYIILTSNEWISPESHRQAAIERASSAENRNGELIKVILVTDVAAEGVDYKNVREIHIMEPWYNMKKIEQIVGRGVRNNSHIYLSHAKRNCTIYHHVALLSDKRESVDFRNYRLSYNKQRRVEAVECLLQQHSIDCNLNIDVRNIELKPETIETSQGIIVDNFVRTDPAAKLELCDAICKPEHSITEDNARVGLRPQMVKYEADHYITHIQSLFENTVTIDRVTIGNQLGVPKNSSRNEILDLALVAMVSHRTVFKGYNQRSGYLLHINGSYVFQPLDIVDTKITVIDRMTPRRKIIVNIPIRDTIEAKNIEVPGVGFVVSPAVGAKITTRINADYSKFQKIINVDNENDPIIYDMVIDRLPQDALMYIIISNTDGPWIDALKRGGYLYAFDNNLVIYLPETNTIKIYRNNILTDLPDAFIGRIYTMIGAYVRKQAGEGALVPIEGKMPVPGFVAHDKNGVSLLKLLNKSRGQGSFCEATATFTVGFMQDNIKATTTNLKALKDILSVSKQGLCHIYEYWLRQKHSVEVPLFHNRVVHAYRATLKVTKTKK
jgi:superfamily II DNA or RNA helicase